MNVYKSDEYGYCTNCAAYIGPNAEHAADECIVAQDVGFCPTRVCVRMIDGSIKDNVCNIIAHRVLDNWSVSVGRRGAEQSSSLAKALLSALKNA